MAVDASERAIGRVPVDENDGWVQVDAGTFGKNAQAACMVVTDRQKAAMFRVPVGNKLMQKLQHSKI